MAQPQEYTVVLVACYTPDDPQLTTRHVESESPADAIEAALSSARSEGFRQVLNAAVFPGRLKDLNPLSEFEVERKFEEA